MVGVDEMSFTVETEFLSLSSLKTPNQTLKMFSRWEYEIHGNHISICLEDFIEMYSDMIDSPSQFSHQKSAECPYRFYACL